MAETARAEPPEARVAAVEAALAELCGEGLEVVCELPRDRVDELPAAERSCIERAGPKRRAQFSTGRVCARRALRRLGLPDAPLPILESRAPAWPDGVVGSISHTDGCCVAMAGVASRWLAVGLDVESAAPLAPGVEARVCTPAEREWLASRDPAERGALAKIFFSAKEAVYKCQHPLCGLPLGFQDVQLELGLDDFRAVVGGASPLPVGRERLGALSGRIVRAAGFLVTAVAVPREPAA